jgi:thiosulfate dehydrogenase [quinone] large subunit
MTMHRGTRSADTHEAVVIPGAAVTSYAAKGLAVLRIVTGFVFLWAFFDKLFGWHYSTASSKAWIHGGSPTKGFLSSVEVGPLRSTFHSMAGDGWVNWLFMLALLGIGAALVAGVALRMTAAAGVILMALMWLAEFPLAQHTSTGALSGSVNPLVDYHVIYAIGMIVIAATYAATPGASASSGPGCRSSAGTGGRCSTAAVPARPWSTVTMVSFRCHMQSRQCPGVAARPVGNS